MSSPLRVPQGLSLDFDSLLASSSDLPTFADSSPVHSRQHATFDFHTDLNSPHTVGKTPLSKVLKTGVDAYLVSPMASVSVPVGVGNSFGAKIASTSSRASPLYRRSMEDEIKVVEPTNPWEQEPEVDYAGGELNFESPYHETTPFASPAKVKSITATPSHLRTYDVTPGHSPSGQAFSPLSTKRRQTHHLGGLGSPSTMRSGGRSRQPTFDGVPPSPSLYRRRQASQLSIDPLAMSRNVSTSSSYLAAPAYEHDRVVSNASIMTASTSYEVVSPRMSAFPQPDFGILASQSLPELIGSHHPSPQLSAGRSPNTPTAYATFFHASPIPGEFDAQGDMSLMGGISHIMGQPGSVPNSSSMASVASFAPPYRAATLDTIVETPAMPQTGSIPQDAMLGYHSGLIPHQPTLPSHGFQPMEYPQVPGAQFSLPMTDPQPLDIQAWSAQTYSVNANNMPAFGYATQLPVMQRHASASSFGYDPASNDMRLSGPPPMFQRSVSAPYPQAMPMATMPSMTMPMSMSTGGLFGPSQDTMSLSHQQYEHPPPSFHPYMPQQELSSAPPSTTTSPDTPRKRQQYPRVGNPLRPGPKPKAKTPKKGRSVSNPSSSPMPYQGVDPALLGQNSSLPRIDETLPEAMLDGPSPPKALDFGPDLSTVSMQRTVSIGASSMTAQPVQPQLIIMPPKGSERTDAGGLPKEFLEKMYETVPVFEGSATGQAVKRFKCLIEGCYRIFPRKSAIHSHIQTHLEDKPFVCTHEDCGAAFVRQHDLRRHTRIHSGTKPFPCPCGKGFARGDALHRHRQRGICIGSVVPRRESSKSPPPRFNPYHRPM